MLVLLESLNGGFVVFDGEDDEGVGRIPTKDEGAAELPDHRVLRCALRNQILEMVG